MKAYHITTSEEAYKSILREGKLRAGKNVSDARKFAHISLSPPTPGDELISYYVAGGFEERWILEVEVPNDISLEDDPATEYGYEGEWKVFEGDLPVKILSVEHVRDLEKWNRKELGPYPERQAEDGEFTNKEIKKLFPKEGWSKFR